MLPNETKERKRIADSLPDQLTYCHRLLREFLQLIEVPIEFHSGFPPIVIDMALGLHVRIARKYRQVLLLADAGQADGAEVICRSMFEAFLAQAFVCRPDVTLRRENGGAVDLHGYDLTQEFRAVLYYAHDYIHGEKKIEHMDKFVALKDAAKSIREVADPELEKLKELVGPSWAKALRGNTCSGLPVSDFAYSIGDEPYMWYRTVYSDHSSHVHPGEHRRFARRDPVTGRTSICWFDSNEDIARALLYSSAVLGLATTEFARMLNPTDQRYIDARAFEDGYAELKQVFIALYDGETPT